MSISQTTSARPLSGPLFCPQCNAIRPPAATFCGSCGERLERQTETSLLTEQDITDRYRITTLVRRRPYINLYFAMDNRPEPADSQSRAVAVRDIEVEKIEKESREQIAILAQQEYDDLRRWQIPHTLSCIDLRAFQGHFFLISGMPVNTEKIEKNPSDQRLYTLQDFLQSGQGLPKEARSLEWIRSICHAMSGLHQHQILIGDLDPYTVVLNKNSIEAEPKVMISWISPTLQKLLPEPSGSATPQISYFSAPEALAGNAEIRSDIYSIGALLYLLLTGTPPGESTLRNHQSLHSPREINSRISQHIDEAVMQALALEPEDRFSSVTALLAALNYNSQQLAPRKAAGASIPPRTAVPVEAETVRIIPLSEKEVIRWRSAEQEKQRKEKVAEQATLHIPTIAPLASPPFHAEMAAEKRTEQARGAAEKAANSATSSRQMERNNHTPPFAPAQPRPSWKLRISRILLARRLATPGKAEPRPQQAKRPTVPKTQKQPLPEIVLPETLPSLPDPNNTAKISGDSSFLKQFQHLILGQQQHTINAAAIIETPVRVRPEQPYNIRLHIMGRDEPTLQAKAKKDEQATGLSAMIHGDIVRIEVRSILQQGYTYVLQQANVTIPANRYEAEVTIPMQPQTGAASGRRDRLHIFFMDEQRQALYEKPFVIEVFISPLVQFGREGHQVLTIPI
jgi:serine/threonine protein kinase